jgi:hypothetical protein
MDAGKLRAGGARRVVVSSIPFSYAASEGQEPVAGATRQLQAAEPVLPNAWSHPGHDPLAPAAFALSEKMRPGRAPAVAWATAFGMAAAFTAILLGWLALREDSLLPKVMGGPVEPQSIRHGEPAAHPPRPTDAPAAVLGQAPITAGYGLRPIPIEPWRTANPIDKTPALVYALTSPMSQKPLAPDESLLTMGEIKSAVAVASSELSEAGARPAAHALPAVRLVADAQGAPKLDPSALIARGDEFLWQSDVISARLFYRLAAANGSAAGAIAMGSTYDPVFLERNAVRGVKPEPRRALEWYEKAVELGDPGGKARSAELLNVLRIDAARGDAQARAILEKAIQ